MISFGYRLIISRGIEPVDVAGQGCGTLFEHS